MSLTKEFIKGIYRENPVLRLMLGLCPVLATSSSVSNAIGMSAATTFVLVCSNFVISLIRKGVPAKIRIPIFIIVIASFVTLVEMVMAGFFPALSKSLGNFISLIVVNCIILGRAEAFASKNTPISSIIDGLGMGAGFAFAMILIASVREILGAGTWLGFPLFGTDFEPIAIFVMSPGAFLTIGFLVAFLNWIEHRRSAS
ncbi:electron transport complex subunit E [bacterium]|nr:electron transport complex subunit E [bacterium]